MKTPHEALAFAEQLLRQTREELATAKAADKIRLQMLEIEYQDRVKHWKEVIDGSRNHDS